MLNNGSEKHFLINLIAVLAILLSKMEIHESPYNTEVIQLSCCLFPSSSFIHCTIGLPRCAFVH